MFMRAAQIILTLLAGLVLTGCTTPPSGCVYDFGPLAASRSDVDGGHTRTALGPFIAQVDSPRGDHYRGVRPFYTRTESYDGQRVVQDGLWPLATAKQLDEEFSWRLLLAMYHNFDSTNPEGRYSFWFLPLYYQGRDAQGDGYVGLFPLGGSIHEFLGRDEINFALFPLWLNTRINDIESNTWLWPIFSRTVGDDIYRWRVFPLYGYSKFRDDWEKSFVLWPLYTRAKFYYEDTQGGGFILFPLFGHMKLTDQENWWLIPPLFHYTTSERQNLIYAPWPFITIARGEKDKTYVWPLWGSYRDTSERGSFFLWPFGSTRHQDEVGHRSHMFRIMPFLDLRSVKAVEEQDGMKIETEAVARYSQLWPLGNYMRQDDLKRFRLLDLWPFKDRAPIERNWTPLWTLYQQTWGEEGAEASLLWGLYRYERRTDERKYQSLFPVFDYERDAKQQKMSWNLLKGLVGYESGAGGGRVRLLYFLKFGHKEKQP